MSQTNTNSNVDNRTYLQNLNREQKEAINHKNGPLLIVAGAGTGKTTVVTARVANIIKKGWAQSGEVLALTFTEKVATEMEERVVDILSYGYFDLWISTFHGFAEKILREHGLEIGIPTDFALLNEFEQYILFKKNIDKFNLEYYKPLGNPTKFIKAFLNHFSRAKDENITPSQYLEYAYNLKNDLEAYLKGDKSKEGRILSLENFKDAKGNFDKEIAEAESEKIREVAEAYRTYQNLLLDNNYLDFGDLIMYCLKLLKERSAIREKYREQFKYILVDEFQDTNWVQYELVKMLTPPDNNLTVVGDDDQSIFAFRGASMSNILQFKKDFSKAKQVFLVKNYRNAQRILDLSYNFITQNNPNRLEAQLNTNSKLLNKKLQSQIQIKGGVNLIEAKDFEEEMEEVTSRIWELKNSEGNVSWNGFAILVRTNGVGQEVCEYLQKKGFPYFLYSPKGLYNKSLIMDVIAYLKVLEDHYDSVSLYRVLNLDPLNFTQKELIDFNYWAEKKALSLFEVLESASRFGFGKDTSRKCEEITEMIKKHSRQVRSKNASEVYIDFLNESGLLNYLAKQEDYDMGSAVLLTQFMNRIRKFEKDAKDKRLSNFLTELQMEIDAGETGDLPLDLEAGPEAIKVMTVHSAKGLEFEYVFGVCLADKKFPTVDRKEPIMLPAELIKETIPEGDIHLQEERRLFYVAMTRAKRSLYLSWALDYGGKQLKKPSRFLVECGLTEFPKNRSRVDKKTEPSDLLTKAKGKLSEDEEKKGLKALNLKPPSSFSYTQITAFSNCPYQYKLAHIVRIPTKGKPSFSFGKTMHNTLYKVFELVMNRSNSKEKKQEHSLITLEEVMDIYRKNWVEDWYNSAKQKNAYWEKGKNILKEFYELYKDNWPRVLFIEKDFNLAINVEGEVCRIKGAMDRIDETKEGKVKIIDYKTGSPKQKHSFRQKQQLFLYQWAAQELFKREVYSVAFYYLEDNTEYEFRGSDKEIEKTKKNFRETIKKIKKGEFTPQHSPLCKYCDFRNICEYSK